MNPISEIEFAVDEQYENEKGVFTVLSIHRNVMVIRWESGEEMRTDVELQRNIQSRRQWEQIQNQKTAKAGQGLSGKDPSAKGPLAFNGLQAGDFKKSASGTRWRGRNQLGGEVTQRLPESRFEINSWALGNKPEMYWMDAQHQKRDDAQDGAKFFFRVHPEDISYGFSIARQDAKGQADQCWDAFVDWLTQEESNLQLLALASEYDLKIYNHTDSHAAVLSSKDGAWCLDDGQEQKRLNSISAFIGSMPKMGAISLEIAMQKDKNETLSAGKHIADDVAKLFARLMPLYHAAWPVLV